MPTEDAVVRIDDLDTDLCWRLLAQTPLGRVAFVVRGEPMLLPVNHVVDGHSVVIRTGQTDLLEAIAGGTTVVFEVDEGDPSSETGWSVVMKGYASEVSDAAELADVARLPLHSWAAGRKDHWLRIVPWSVSGRAISRKRMAPHGDFEPYRPTG